MTGIGRLTNALFLKRFDETKHQRKGVETSRLLLLTTKSSIVHLVNLASSSLFLFPIVAVVGAFVFVIVVVVAAATGATLVASALIDTIARFATTTRLVIRSGMGYRVAFFLALVGITAF